MLRGLDRRIQQDAPFPAYVADDPPTCVVRCRLTEMLGEIRKRLKGVPIVSISQITVSLA
jgi:hypothetical protein